LFLDVCCVIDVRLKPSASRERVVSVEGNEVGIAVTQPPVDGKANEALVKFLSKILHVAKSSVVIKRGLTSRNKTVELHGLDRDYVINKFSEALMLYKKEH
jgi:uncharacterized protein